MPTGGPDRTGFEQWGLTLARVATPFVGMAIVFHEVIVAREPRTSAVTAGLAMMGIVEAAVAAVRRHRNGNGNGG